MRTAVTNVGPGVITIELVKVEPDFFLTYVYLVHFLTFWYSSLLSLGVHILLHVSYSSNYILFMERKLTPCSLSLYMQEKTILLL